MLDHLFLSVSDVDCSISFYASVLTVLGILFFTIMTGAYSESGSISSVDIIRMSEYI